MESEHKTFLPVTTCPTITTVSWTLFNFQLAFSTHSYILLSLLAAELTSSHEFCVHFQRQPSQTQLTHSAFLFPAPNSASWITSLQLKSGPRSVGYPVPCLLGDVIGCSIPEATSQLTRSRSCLWRVERAGRILGNAHSVRTSVGW